MISEAVVKELYDIYSDHPEVTTDSRNVPAGSVFFALRGPSFDGNIFAAGALRAGAAWAVVDDPGVIPGPGYSPGKYFLVENVLQCLQGLAAYHRARLDIPVIAITGTNGKTTTKELTSAILSRRYKVHSTYGNLNNHIGVPLTLLSIPADTRIAIIEMGASGPGEIADLCGIAAPGYGLITNIGLAHLEGFGGPEGVKKAKGELYDYLAARRGTIFVNGEYALLMNMAADRENLERVIYDISSVRNMENNLTGGYNLYNIAAAAAIGRYFEVSEDDIASSVAEYYPESNRSRVIVTDRNTVLADCYNANPSSMAAAIGNFGAGRIPAAPDGKPVPKVLILGDMLELGVWSDTEHDRILKEAMGSGASAIYLVGDNFGEAYGRTVAGNEGDCGCGPSWAVFPDVSALSGHFKETPLSGTYVLLKGSRGVALEKIIPLL